jgi:hypothetical protein
LVESERSGSIAWLCVIDGGLRSLRHDLDLRA